MMMNKADGEYKTYRVVPSLSLILLIILSSIYHVYLINEEVRYFNMLPHTLLSEEAIYGFSKKNAHLLSYSPEHIQNLNNNAGYVCRELELKLRTYCQTLYGLKIYHPEPGLAYTGCYFAKYSAQTECVMKSKKKTKLLQEYLSFLSPQLASSIKVRNANTNQDYLNIQYFKYDLVILDHLLDRWLRKETLETVESNLVFIAEKTPFLFLSTSSNGPVNEKFLSKIFSNHQHVRVERVEGPKNIGKSMFFISL